ncbi:MAG: acyl-CoA thioesterase [Actinomycetota bacterium]
MSPYRHSITVRYGECDMQRVVFNANYLAYVDDAVDNWMRSALSSELEQAGDPTNLHNVGFDFMVKKATVTWTSAVRFAETVDLDCSIARWGTTSFDVEVLGTVGGDKRFDAVVTDVSVNPDSQRPVPVPALVKDSLGFTNPS